MPLQGDLKEFGTPDVFQLLEQHAKSGCLQIETETGNVEVYFRDGRIVGVLPGGRSVLDQVLRVLCRLGYLAEEEAARIRKLREIDLRSIRKILQQEGIVDSRELDELFRQQIEELIYPLLKMKRGRFTFASDRSLPSELEFLEPLHVEPMVLDGVRRLDEWPMIRKRVGPFGIVPQRKIPLETWERSSWKKRLLSLLVSRRDPEDSAPAREQPEGTERKSDADLPVADRIVYALIDGKSTIEEIIRASSLGEYSTCKALLSLLDRGFIQLISLAPVASPERPDAAAVRLAAAARAVRALLISAGLVAVLWVGHTAYSVVRVPVWSYSHGTESLLRLLNQHRRQGIVEALELYRQEEGHYPEKLSDLVHDRFLRPDALAPLGPNAFSYLRESPLAFRLHMFPAGPGPEKKESP